MLELTRLAVATRPGFPQAKLDAVLAELATPERVVFFEIEPLRSRPETSATGSRRAMTSLQSCLPRLPS